MCEKVEQKTVSDNARMIACTVAFNGALQTLIALLEKEGTLERGQFSEGLRAYIKCAEDTVDPLTVKLLEEFAKAPRRVPQ